MQHSLSAIKRIENRAKEIKGAISLAQGIPSFSSHPLIQQAVIEAIQSNKVDKYSAIAGLGDLRNFISEKLAREGMIYNPETEIIVTAGGIQALSTTLLALLEPGDEVLFPTPSYPYSERIIRMAKGKAIPLPLNEEKGWRFDLDLLKRKINRRTKAIILCNPNNPTGSVLSQKELMTIGILAQRHKFFIILDDIYEKFYFGEKPLFTLCALPQFKKQIIRIISLSKEFSLSGWRIGFVHADKEYIVKILPVHDMLVNCAPVVSQYAALAALQNEEIIFAEYFPLYKQRRELMGNYLKTLHMYMDFVYPQGAYYFFPRVIGISDSERFCFDLLEKARVATVPGDDFGIGGKGHIRLCFGKSEEEIHGGMTRIVRYFSD